MEIVLYTRVNCLKCFEIEDKLNEYGIPYVKKQIDTNLEDKREYSQRGFFSIPSLYVKVESGRMRISNVRLQDIDILKGMVQG